MPDLIEVKRKEQGPSPQHQATPSDPGRLVETQPPSTESSISMEDLPINTPERHGGLTHHAAINQEPDAADSPAGMQAIRFQQDPTHNKVKSQDFGEVRVQDFREVRIQDRNLTCMGAKP